jgi:hypothetical protein
VGYALNDLDAVDKIYRVLAAVADVILNFGEHCEGRIGNPRVQNFPYVVLE